MLENPKTYRVTQTPSTASFTGQIVFGERPAKLCKNQWSSLPEVKNKQLEDQQWTFNVDK